MLATLYPALDMNIPLMRADHLKVTLTHKFLVAMESLKENPNK